MNRVTLDIGRANPNGPTLVPNLAQTADPRLNLLGLSRAQLAEALVEAGVPERQSRMRASQLWGWIYNRGITDFSLMTNVAKELRGKLAENFTLARPEIVTEQISTDGTRKWLLRLAPDADGRRHDVETVYIPEEDRGTLCVSSQVGCTLTCTFCHTGTQTLVRNLTAGEIVGQLLVARDRLGEWPEALAVAVSSPIWCSWAWASPCIISTM